MSLPLPELHFCKLLRDVHIKTIQCHPDFSLVVDEPAVLWRARILLHQGINQYAATCVQYKYKQRQGTLTLKIIQFHFTGC